MIKAAMVNDPSINQKAVDLGVTGSSQVDNQEIELQAFHTSSIYCIKHLLSTKVNIPISNLVLSSES